MAMDFDTAYAKAIAARDDFNKTYEKTGFGPAGASVAKGLEEFTKANAAFENGDVMGGSAAVLRGIGALAGVLALGGGPLGAAIGALVGAIAEVIAVILEALKPASESLEAKIERLLDDASLKDLHSQIKGDFDAWKMVQIQIDGAIAQGGAFTWKHLNETFPWADHYGKIGTGFDSLAKHQADHSKEWLPLFDLNVTYALNYWVYLESMAAIVKRSATIDPASHAMVPLEETLAAKRTFYNMRQLVATEFSKSIAPLIYPSVNEVGLHSLYLNTSYNPYTAGVGTQGWQRNSLMYRLGVLNGLENKEVGPGQCVAFALAASGTFFSVGTDPYTLYVGRLGGNWHQVPQTAFGGDSVDQVFIGQVSDDNVLIVCLHGGGRKISFCMFDDRSGTQHETTHDGWTAGEWRFGQWTTYPAPDGITILTMALMVQPSGWNMLAFALDAAGEGALYDVKVSAFTIPDGWTKYSETVFGKDWLAQQTFGVAPAPGRSELSPCTISLVGSNIFFHVGNRWCQRVDNAWFAADLKGQLGSGVNVYQARAYADETVLYATNQGLSMRFGDPERREGEEYYKFFKDEALQTVWFSKAVSSQALTARELLAQVREAAKQSPESLIADQ